MASLRPSLETFLNRYSTVPNAFVDDLIAFYDAGTVQTDLVINIDAVCKWLRVRKDNMMALLRKHYKSDIDYTTRKLPNKPTGRKYGGNNYREVLITPDCFKRVCMLTRNKMGEAVRSYFIELESLIVRYNQQLMHNIEADVRRLERNMQPRDPADNHGYIYVIRASDAMDGVFKIGRAKDLNRRLDQYKTGRADTLQVVWKYRIDALKQVEGCVHALLRDQRYKGCRRRCNEVYKLDMDDIKAVIAGCDKLTLKTEYTRRKPLTMAGGYYLVLRRGEQPTGVVPEKSNDGATR